MPMKQRVVPWTSEKEFIQVAEWIYSNDPDQQRLAANTLNTWRSRVPPSKIPRSILCTADLLNANCQCELGLALALMRFVSVISSEEQDRNRYDYALPVHSVAGKIGIPGWLVDLRNDTAHNVLPKLPLLQAGHARALLWLRQNYWTQHVNAYYTQQDELLAAQQDLETSLIEYQGRSFDCLVKSLSPQETKAELKPSRLAICRLLKNHTLCSRGFEILLSPGYLLPTSEQLRAMKLKSIARKTTLSSKFVELWLPLLISMRDSSTKDCHLLSQLIDAMFHKLASQPTPSEDNLDDQNIRSQLLAWCRGWLLAILALETKQGDNVLSWCLDVETVSKVHWHRILYTVVFESLSSGLSELFQLVLDTHLPKLSEDVKKSLTETSRLALGSSSSIKNSASASSLTLSTSDIDMQLADGEEPKHVGWSLDRSLTNWADYPLGTCPLFDLEDWTSLIAK